MISRGHLGNSAEEDAIYSCRVYVTTIGDFTSPMMILPEIINPLIYPDANILLYML
jgi:hypothetical protein